LYSSIRMVTKVIRMAFAVALALAAYAQASTEAPFAKTRNSNVCPDGYGYISTAQECSDAAKYLFSTNFEDRTITHRQDHSAFPRGCFNHIHPTHPAGNLVYSSTSVTGSSHLDGEIICKKLNPDYNEVRYVDVSMNAGASRGRPSEVPPLQVLNEIRTECKNLGTGWDLVSIRDATHVIWLRDQASVQGVSDLSGSWGTALGFDKDNTGTQHFDLTNFSRDVTPIFDTLRAAHWPGDAHLPETDSSCPQMFAGFGWGLSRTPGELRPGIEDWGTCHVTKYALCEFTTQEPTSDPTPGPTGNPTPGPTSNPTPGPTSNPTPGPTSNPTPGPTSNPTPGPTGNPTPGPTSQLDGLVDAISEVTAMVKENSDLISEIKGLLSQRDQAPSCYGRRAQE
jgi:hypothetical protein